ncbi:MAG: alpha/beta fold hydrolase [Gammaproteobacteria bacterium]|nr:alpha/beta fold hydrolase [Gammaproteobacteria bacterium]MDP7154255.1 alpha/beta fold hydrolase [Gammaproteobacteria bacterium]MDP7296854.1 alpha/beta fold hydrolase [Gammaproteobacteria bacterium]MDP7418990.1 alpha/beta fold hydrolase [Gammaproteobacteria bacterium]MDP7660048.1 alpha/beta fold hydrolase [Gammaproteobacteria bacterium]
MSSAVSRREALMIDGPTGQLEALLETPRANSGRRVAVLCHPHPLHQGSLMNKVVYTLSRAMNVLGVTAIRFNFRGVGASEGTFANGIGETDDVLAVADWAAQHYPDTELCLLGFSFGGMVAARAALSARPIQLVTVAPAASRMAGLLDGCQPECPWLIVQGEADDVVPCAEVIEWVNGLSPGPELVVMPDTGHFFHGRLTKLREIVVNHLVTQWGAT